MQIPSISFADWQKNFRVLSLAEFVALDSCHSFVEEWWTPEQVCFRVYANNAWIVQYSYDPKNSFGLYLDGKESSGPLEILEMYLYIYDYEEGSI